MIVVGGEALMDILVSPGGEVMLRPGGGSFNVARTVARLGAPTMFLGRLSDDGFGRSLRRVLLEDGVALACPDPLPAPTTLAVADLDAEGQARYRFYLVATSAVGLVDEDTAPALATLPTAVHVGSLGLVAEPVASALEAFVGNLPADVLVIVDPNCRPGAIADGPAYRARLSRILRRCDVLKTSREDLAYLAPDVPAVDAGRALLDSGPSAVLLTSGSEPAMAFVAEGELSVPVPAVRVVDTVGAGDAFCGAFLAWWTLAGLGRTDLRSLDVLRGAVTAAVEVSAMTCERAGATPPHLSELQERGRFRPVAAPA